MNTQLIYNDEPYEDVINILSFINAWTKKLGILDVAIDSDRIEEIVDKYHHTEEFPHNGGVNEASAFKQVAFFVCHFVAGRPLVESFDKKIVGELAEIDNHQNAMVAFEIAIQSLFHSNVIRPSKTPGGESIILTIDKPIFYSKHSYIDIVETLSSITPANFKLVSILFEQLVYKTNPHVQYSNPTKSGWGVSNKEE